MSRCVLQAQRGPCSGQYLEGFEYGQGWTGGRPRWVASQDAAAWLSAQQAEWYIRFIPALHGVRPVLLDNTPRAVLFGAVEVKVKQPGATLKLLPGPEVAHAE